MANIKEYVLNALRASIDCGIAEIERDEGYEKGTHEIELRALIRVYRIAEYTADCDQDESIKKECERVADCLTDLLNAALQN